MSKSASTTVSTVALHARLMADCTRSSSDSGLGSTFLDLRKIPFTAPIIHAKGFTNKNFASPNSLARIPLFKKLLV